MNKFAERLKELRLENNLSQSDLAKELGVSPACINRWEASLRLPNVDSIILICQYFKVSSDYLIGLED